MITRVDGHGVVDDIHEGDVIDGVPVKSDSIKLSQPPAQSRQPLMNTINFSGMKRRDAIDPSSDYS